MGASIDKEALRREIKESLGRRKEVRPPMRFTANDKTHIRHVVGVISGKGGVGKSFVCASLAISLQKCGYKVGILDADITGPSIPRMFGLGTAHAYGKEDKIVPLTSQGGITIMSTNLVVAHENDPVLWRGPMLMGALKQFFEDTLWGDLDYLLVDMPPGTGDVAITVFQSFPIDGVIIVSTPQDLVQMVVGKALKMAQMMQVDVLGLVENMAYVPCPHCDEKIEVFGPSKLLKTASDFDVDALDELPLDPYIATAVDHGLLEDTVSEQLLPKALTALKALEEGDRAPSAAASQVPREEVDAGVDGETPTPHDL